MHVMDPPPLTPISAFYSRNAGSAPLGSGSGEAHAHVVRFEPGGAIGPHPAGFAQLFIPVSGSGWIAGPDGAHRGLGPGQVGYVARGEIHSKGSDAGMVAIMVQVRDFAPHDGGNRD